MTSIAELAAETEAEEGKQTREGASGASAENHAEAKVEDANAGVDSGLGGGFPLLAEIGEKAGAEGRGFVDKLVAAIAVNTCGRGDKERLWRTAEAGKGGGEGAGGVDAALGNLRACSRESSDGRRGLRRRDGSRRSGLQDIRSREWLAAAGPTGADWARRGQSVRAGERRNCARQGLPEGGAEHSGGAGKKKAWAGGRWIDGADVAFLLMNTIAAKGEIDLAGRKIILIWTII